MDNRVGSPTDTSISYLEKEVSSLLWNPCSVKYSDMAVKQEVPPLNFPHNFGETTQKQMRATTPTSINASSISDQDFPTAHVPMTYLPNISSKSYQENHKSTANSQNTLLSREPLALKINHHYDNSAKNKIIPSQTPELILKREPLNSDSDFHIQVNTTALYRKMSDRAEMFVCKKCPSLQVFPSVIEFTCHHLTRHQDSWYMWCNICNSELKTSALASHAKLHDVNNINVEERKNRDLLCVEMKKEDLDSDEMPGVECVLADVDDRNDSESSSDEPLARYLTRHGKTRAQPNSPDIITRTYPNPVRIANATNGRVCQFSRRGRRPGNQAFLCDNCGRNYKSKKGLERHLSGCGLYDCEGCSLQLSKAAFQKHCLREHNTRMTLCEKCNLFYDECKIVDHYAAAHKNWQPPVEYECEFCRKRFRFKAFITRHVVKHLQPKKSPENLLCTICGKTFCSPFGLQLHVRLHMKDYRYKCDVCEKKFVAKVMLKQHLRTHTGERRIQCSDCPKTFCVPNSLRIHRERMHSESAKFKCSVCGLSLSTQAHLDQHHANFSGTCASTSCNFCHKVILKHNLKRHMLTHNDIRLFQCTICFKKFTQKFSLKEHLNIHTGEKPFKCAVCGAAFSNNSSLYTHKQVIHEGKKARKYTPKKCNFNSNNELQCADCEYKTTKQGNLYAHIYAKHKRIEYQCEICGRIFYPKYKLKDHLNAHLGIKPYKCPGCFKDFSSFQNLWQHKKKYCHVLSKMANS